MASSMPFEGRKDVLDITVMADERRPQDCVGCRLDPDEHKVIKLLLDCGHILCADCYRDNAFQFHCNLCGNSDSPNNEIDAEVNLNTEPPPEKEEAPSVEAVMCGAVDCTTAAEFFCKKCATLFCSPHKKTHDLLLINHPSVGLSEYLVNKEKLLPVFCAEHADRYVLLGCEKCYAILCDKCVDAGKKKCAGKGEDHTIKSLAYVADKARKASKQLLSHAKDLEKNFSASMIEVQQKSATLELRHKERTKEIDSIVEHLKHFVEQGFSAMRLHISETNDHNSKLMEQANDGEVKVKYNIGKMQEWTEKLTSAADQTVLAESGDTDSRTQELQTLSRNIKVINASLMEASSSKIFDRPIEEVEPVSFPSALKLEPQFREYPDARSIFHMSSGELICCRLCYIEVLSNQRRTLSFEHIIAHAAVLDELIFVLCIANTGLVSIHYYAYSSKMANFKKAVGFQPKCKPTSGFIAVTKKHLAVVLGQNSGIGIHNRQGFKHLFTMNVGMSNVFGLKAVTNETLLLVGTDNVMNGCCCMIDIAPNARPKWTVGGLASPCGVAVNLDQRYILVVSDSPYDPLSWHINIITFGDPNLSLLHLIGTGELIQRVPIPIAKTHQSRLGDLCVTGTHDISLVQTGVGLHTLSPSKLLMLLSSD